MGRPNVKQNSWAAIDQFIRRASNIAFIEAAREPATNVEPLVKDAQTFFKELKESGRFDVKQIRAIERLLKSVWKLNGIN